MNFCVYPESLLIKRIYSWDLLFLALRIVFGSSWLCIAYSVGENLFVLLGLEFMYYLVDCALAISWFPHGAWNIL